MNCDYVLGHSSGEVRRLELQAELFAPGSERMLRAAGLRPGMSVLDIGTGAGDVAMIAATIVGRSGSVLGIDREPSVLERARARVAASGFPQIRFEAAALEALTTAGPFDAVVGRYVLVHQADPLALLRRAAGLLRPGGMLLLIEPGLSEPASPDAPVGEQCSHPRVAVVEDTFRLILTAFTLAGARVGAGKRLAELFGEAGLPRPIVRREALVGEPGSAMPEWLSLTLRSLLPVLEKHGLAPPSAADTLQARTEAALAEAGARMEIEGMLCGAWAQVD